jgi:hypothetical protein
VKKSAAAASAVALGIGAVAVPLTATAEARSGGDHRKCVTYGEFRQIDKAMRRVAVFRLLDGRGKRVSITSASGLKDEMRKWRSCPGNAVSTVYVNFDDYSHGSFSKGGPMEAAYKDHSVFW